MRSARRISHWTLLSVLPLACVFFLIGCRSISDLERGGGGVVRTYDAPYEDVFQSVMDLVDDSNYKIKKTDQERGEILAQGHDSYKCFGLLLGIYFDRTERSKTKLEILVLPVHAGLTDDEGCPDNSDNFANRLDRRIRTLMASGHAKPSSTASAGESSITPSDVDNLTGSAKSTIKKRAYAVVIGIEKYRGKLPKADFADRDARVVGDYLTKVLGYLEENVVVLENDNATRTDMEKYLEGWLPNRVEKDASVFFYFSGHGTPNAKSGDAYLVPYDGDPAFVEKTGYPMQRLYEQLGKLPTKEVVVVLDTCFSGAGGRSVIAQGTRPMVLSIENPILTGGKTVVLAASAGDQISSTYRQKSHGLLTYFFLRGLQGEADRNKDGTIDLAELFEYVKPQVERVARREFNNDQIPQLFGSPEILKRGIKLVEPPAR